MSKISEANFKVQGNFYPGADGPFDARTKVDTLSDLTNPNSWKEDSDNTTDATLYNGMVVSIGDTGDVYVLKDKTNVTSLSSWKKVGSDVPKKQHELIYADPNNDGELELNTKQFMQEDVLVVDTPEDLAECKGFVNITPKEIADTWSTEVISSTTSQITEKSLYPGGIKLQNNGFWSYNSQKDTIDATFNDNENARLAILHNPSSLSGSNMTYDGLSGYYEEDSLNDGIGLAFIGYGDTPETDSDGNTYYPTVILKISGEPRVAAGNFITNPSDFTVYRRSTLKSDDKESQSSTTGNDPRNRYSNTTALTSFGIVGTSNSAYVDASATSVETGKSVVKPTYITRPSEWHSSSYYIDKVAYIRLYVKKVGNVISWQVSQITEGNPTDVATEKPELIKGVKVEFDMDSYTVRYITPELEEYKSYSCIAFKDYIDILKNDCHFGFSQCSTPCGRFYNIDSVGTVPILDVSTEKVWIPTGLSSNPWEIETGTVPRDYFTGSRESYNDVTKKLWYSNGIDIYQIAKNGDDTPVQMDYLPLSGGTMTGDISFAGAAGKGIVFDAYGNGLKVDSTNNATLSAYQKMTVSAGAGQDLELKSGTSLLKVDSSGVHCSLGFHQDSDFRKKDVHGELPLDKAYDLIDKCSTILYTLKDDESHKEQIGLIAQEVEEFFPEIVATDKEGFKSLDYSKLTVVLLRVLKDLIGRVGKLERKETVYV